MITISRRPRTWIVVADGARARCFTPSADSRKLVPARSADMVSPESRGLARDLKSDKPGRVYSSSRSGTRHALEPRHDYHKYEKHRFSASLADVLDTACGQGEFDQLVLVAPRRSLGELRTMLTKRVQSCLRQEIPKDLTNETPTSLSKRLVSLMLQPLYVRVT